MYMHIYINIYIIHKDLCFRFFPRHVSWLKMKKEKHNHMTHKYYSFVKHLIFARNHDFHFFPTFLQKSNPK